MSNLDVHTHRFDSMPKESKSAREGWRVKRIARSMNDYSSQFKKLCQEQFNMFCENEIDYLDKIIKFAKNKNQAAFEILFKKYESMIISASRRYRVSGFDPDDLSQEAMIEIWKAIMNFDPIKSQNFSDYAKLRVASHEATLLRNSNREKRIPLNKCISTDEIAESSEYKKEFFVTYVTPEVVVLNNEKTMFIYQLLTAKIGNLTLTQKSAVIFRYLSGYSYAQIANLFSEKFKRKFSIRGIDNIIQKAKKKLQKILKDYCYY